MLLIALLVWPRPSGAPSRWRDPQWLLCLMLPLYMLHQFEEHGIDLLGEHYAFQRSMCAMVGVSDVAACPGDAAFIFAVNVGAVWIAGVCAILWRRRIPLVGACVFSIPLLNAVAHLGSAVRAGAYNPGLVTGVVLFLPVSIYVLRTLVRQQAIALWQLPGVIGSGVLVHAILLGGLQADLHALIPHGVNVAVQAANGFLPLAVGLLLHRRARSVALAPEKPQ